MIAKHLRELVVRPALRGMEVWSQSAEDLVLETAAHESMGFTCLKQICGPALGFCGMEPPTHDDCWQNFLRYKPVLARRILIVCGLDGLAEEFAPGFVPPAELLLFNLRYSFGMCRAEYLRHPGAIPDTLEDRARYWKQYYNTPLGKGRAADFIDNARRYLR